MCHEYGATWWGAETKATAKRTKDAETKAPQTVAARPDEKAKPVPEHKVEEKELVPAE